MLDIALCLTAVLFPAPQDDAPTGDAPAPPAKEFIVAAKLAADAPVVVTLTAKGTVAILDAATGKAHLRHTTALGVDAPRALAISPDGETIGLIGTGSKVHLIRWAEEDARIVVDLAPDDPSTAVERRYSDRIEFGPGNRRLIAATSTTSSVLLDFAGKEIMRPTPGGGGWFQGPWCWSRDDRMLAAHTGDKIVLIDTDEGQHLGTTFDLEGLKATSIDLSAAGDRIAVGGSAHEVMVFNVEGERLWRGAAKFPTDPFLDMRAKHRGRIACVSFSPNGELVAATTAKSTAAALFTAADGTQIAEGRFCGGRMGEPRLISWSADSGRFYHSFASGALQCMVMDVELEDGVPVGAKETPFGEDRTYGPVPQRGWNGRGLQFTRDSLRLLEMPTGKEIWTLER